MYPKPLLLFYNSTYLLDRFDKLIVLQTKQLNYDFINLYSTTFFEDNIFLKDTFVEQIMV